MARIPNRSRFGLGIIDGYASDSAYLAAIGSSPKRGDVYYNTALGKYRYYDGAAWRDLTPVVNPVATLLDRSFVAIPSGSQTVDGVTANVGDVVILAAFDGNAYKVDAGVWTPEPIFQNSVSQPVEGDTVYIKLGNTNADSYFWFDGTNWRILNLLREATQVGAIPYWDGVRYLADNDLLASSNNLTTKADAVADAAQAQSLTIQGGNKTAGTGDGGDLFLKGGTSAGGQQGRARIDVVSTQFVNKAVLPSSPTLGDFLMYNSQFRYWDGSAWKLIYPLPTGTVQGSLLYWDVGSSSYLEDALLTINAASITTPADNVNNALPATAVQITGGNKTAGTGGGGSLALSGGTSVGGSGGQVNIRGGTSPTDRGIVSVNKLEISTPSLTDDDTTLSLPSDTNADAVKAADLSISASNKTAGTGDGGDIFLATGTSLGGLRGSVAITAHKIRLNAQSASDPSGGLTSDVYWNSTEARFKFFDGTSWRPFENSDITSEPTGFENRTSSSLSFNNVSRQLSISVQSPFTSWTVFRQGVKKVFNSTQSVAIPNTTGLYFFYFDSNFTLQYQVGFGNNIILSDVFVATVYWNSGTSVGLLADERHGLTMDGQTHAYLHSNFGTRYTSGLEVSNFILGGDGSLDSHAQLAVSSGAIADEDIRINITDAASPSNPFEQVLSPIAKIPIMYRSGVNGDWVLLTATNFPIKLGATRAQYNQLNGGSWQLTDATGNHKCLSMWLFATNMPDNPVIAIMGQAEYNNINDATANATYESLNFGSLPSAEFKLLYRLIFDTSTAYSNAVKSSLLDVRDFRKSIDAGISQSISPTDHANLSGRSTNNSHPASAISVTAGGFSGIILSGTDTDVQTALASIDSKAASKTLNNLNSPTSVNQSLIPSANITHNLGSTGTRWLQLFAASATITGSIDFASGSGILGSSAVPSDSVSRPSFSSTSSSIAVFTADDIVADANPSNSVLIETGNKLFGTGNSGNVAVKTGTSAGGTRGKIVLDASLIQLGPNSLSAELLPLQSLSVSASQTNSVVFSVSASTYRSIFVEYQLVRGGFTTGGLLTLVNDGTNTSIIDQSTETGDTGVTFSADISGGNIRLLYISDSNGSGTLKYHVRRW